jgi:hypothetical protein
MDEGTTHGGRRPRKKKVSKRRRFCADVEYCLVIFGWAAFKLVRGKASMVVFTGAWNDD